MSWCVSPCIYPVWDSLCFLDLINYFLSHIREVFNYKTSRLVPFSGAPLSGALNAFSSCTRNQRGKKKSLVSSAAPDPFLDSLLAICGTLAPFRLCARRQPQSSYWDPTSKARASAPFTRPPRQVSRQASRAGECWSAPILSVGIPPLCPLHPCCCTLLRGSEAPRLCHLKSPPAKGLPSVWKPFLLHSSLPLVQVPSLFFCL